MTAEAIRACVADYAAGEAPDRATERVAVKYAGSLLEERAPGNSVEVRVPPYLAMQVVAGVRHRRGTPPASVECDARTFLELASGAVSWQAARDSGRLSASGERSDLSSLFPLDGMPMA